MTDIVLKLKIHSLMHHAQPRHREHLDSSRPAAGVVELVRGGATRTSHETQDTNGRGTRSPRAIRILPGIRPLQVVPCAQLST